MRLEAAATLAHERVSSPRDRPTWRASTIAWVIAAQAALFAAMNLPGLPEHLGPSGSPGPRADAAYHAVDVTYYLVSIGLMALIVMRHGRRSLRALWPRGRLGVTGILGWAAVGGVASFAAHLVGYFVAWALLDAEPDGNVTPTCRISGVILGVELMVGAILAPLEEELLFRGVLLRWGALRFGAVASSIATSVLFAAAHWDLDTAPAIFLGGLVSSVLVFKTGSLWPALLVHGVGNAITILLT